MTLPCPSLRSAARWLVALALIPGAKASATETQDRLLVTVEAADPSPQHIALAERIDRDLMAYRFRVEAVDAEGREVALPTATTLAMRIGTGDRGSDLLFNEALRELTIPRPWALRLRTEDSLHFVVESHGTSVRVIRLRVSIEFEPAERERSRLAITSARADNRVAYDQPAGTWEWTQPMDGRLIAISGLALAHVRKVALVDVGSGRVVWSADLGGEMSLASSGSGSPALRLGVPVAAGRVYRLVTDCPCRLPAESEEEPVVALVLPKAAP